MVIYTLDLRYGYIYTLDLHYMVIFINIIGFNLSAREFHPIYLGGSRYPDFLRVPQPRGRLCMNVNRQG